MESKQELQHWGIKGQKWGIRRYQNPDGTLTEAGKKRYYYQNPDGSLTEEGKKNYMTGAKKGKINPKKLSDADLNMINSRFARERTFNENVQKYKESTFSYKLQKAIIDRVKGNGGGGGGKKGGGGKGIGSLLAMPIKKALEDALKFDSNKGGDKEEKRDTPEAEFYKRSKKGRHFVENGYHEDKEQRAAREANGRRFMETGSRDNPMNSRSSKSSEDVLRGRHKGSGARPSNGPRNIRGLPSGGIYMDPSDYSIHSDAIQYVITRDDSANITHFGIKGQKWGVRRFQNLDRTLTAEGKERYGAGKEYDRKVKKGEFQNDPELKELYKMEKKELTNGDYRSERKRIAANHPDGYTDKEKAIISRIQNGEVLDNELVHNIGRDHQTRQFNLGKKYQESTSESEKSALKKEMQHEQILMDYAYDKIPALNRENKYEKEIAAETDTKYIDPTYRKFTTKKEKAAAEAEYLKNTWYGERPTDKAESDKWERECSHLSDRIWNLSYNGYAEKPQSDRVRSMFDYDPDGYRYDRWKPKYEKTEEWKKIQSERQMLKDKTGYTKAEADFQKAGKDGLFFTDKSSWQKLGHAFSVAQRKYSKRVDASNIKQRENKIKDAFNDEITKCVLKDLGYEITDDNIRLIQEVIWYD